MGFNDMSFPIGLVFQSLLNDCYIPSQRLQETDREDGEIVVVMLLLLVAGSDALVIH